MIVDAPRPWRHRRATATGLAALLISLVACGTGGPPTSIEPSTRDAGSARCEVTHDAPPNATIYLSHRAFGAPVTINAGETVAFRNLDNTRHTVDEGTGGHRADSNCINTLLRAHENTVVAFIEPGEYQITCTIHGQMQTVVDVR
ncbi:MAG: hypothetical protein ABIZ71_02420 [Gemmatimonadales bacterium]